MTTALIVGAYLAAIVGTVAVGLAVLARNHE